MPKFKKVVKVSGDTQGIAAEVIERLKPIYALEERMRQSQCSFRTRKTLRKKIAKPILEELHQWLKKQIKSVPSKSKLGLAIAYTLKQWSYLIRYLSHGWAEIDTNWVENQIRPIALGKKNFLFMGHQESATIHALFIVSFSLPF